VLRAATSLGEAAALVADRLDLRHQRFEMVMAGGLFAGRNRLLETTLVQVLHRVAPHAVPVHLHGKPVVGAALEALELAGLAPTPEVHDRLIASSRGLAVSSSG
jgi:hypothetical protein